jgi:hypothetical protein
MDDDIQKGVVEADAFFQRLAAASGAEEDDELATVEDADDDDAAVEPNLNVPQLRPAQPDQAAAEAAVNSVRKSRRLDVDSLAPSSRFVKDSTGRKNLLELGMFERLLALSSADEETRAQAQLDVLAREVVGLNNLSLRLDADLVASLDYGSILDQPFQSIVASKVALANAQARLLETIERLRRPVCVMPRQQLNQQINVGRCDRRCDDFPSCSHEVVPEPGNRDAI